MAPVKVSDIGHVGNSGAATTDTITVGAGGVALGDTIVVQGFFDNGLLGTPSCADSRGNTYHLDFSESNFNDTVVDNVNLCFFSAPVTTALVNGDTITFTHASCTLHSFSATEFSGILTPSPLDVTKGAISSGTAPATGTSAATAQAAELVIAAIGFAKSTVGSETISGATAGYTALVAAHATNGVNIDDGVFPYYLVLAATGTQAFAATLGHNDDWSAALVTYKGAAAPVAQPSRLILQAVNRAASY